MSDADIADVPKPEDVEDTEEESETKRDEGDGDKEDAPETNDNEGNDGDNENKDNEEQPQESNDDGDGDSSSTSGLDVPDADAVESVAQVVADLVHQSSTASIQNPPHSSTTEFQASENAPELSLSSMPMRQYLENIVAPLLVPAMIAACAERPQNPSEFLANFILKNSRE